MLTPVPPSDCTRARESASARLDGELVELQAAQLEAHLRFCPDCRAFASGISATGELLRNAALDQTSEAMFVPVRESRRRIGALPVAAAAAAVVLAVAASSFAVGGYLGHEGSKSATTTRPQTSANQGPVNALVFPALLAPRSEAFYVTSRAIAL